MEKDEDIFASVLSCPHSIEAPVYLLYVTYRIHRMTGTSSREREVTSIGNHLNVLKTLDGESLALLNSLGGFCEF